MGSRLCWLALRVGQVGVALAGYGGLFGECAADVGDQFPVQIKGACDGFVESAADGALVHLGEGQKDFVGMGVVGGGQGGDGVRTDGVEVGDNQLAHVVK